MFSPVEKRRISLTITEELLKMIHAGQFGEGQKLPTERELANLFKVSRASVREALSGLEFMGVVESRVGDGTYVARTTAAPARGLALLESQHSPFDILEARRLLEPLVASLAAERRSLADLADLRAALEQMASEIASQHYDPQTDQRFHLLLAVASQNQALEGMMRYLYSLTREAMWQILKRRIEAVPEHPKNYLEQHQRVLEAVARGDEAAAAAAMGAHLQAVEEDMLDDDKAKESHD